jgi:hypothetical protein
MFSQRLDVTLVTDRSEVAAAFGDAAAWRAAVNNFKLREARETDPRRKRKLRLQLLNAENQLRIANEKEQA